MLIPTNAMQKYLRCMQCGGLIPVNEDLAEEQDTESQVRSQSELVNSFAQLVHGGTYMLFQTSKEAFARVLGETRHLQQSREDEFARALTEFAQGDEPDQVSIGGDMKV